jgi:hypothetical protein
LLSVVVFIPDFWPRGTRELKLVTLRLTVSQYVLVSNL